MGVGQIVINAVTFIEVMALVNMTDKRTDKRTNMTSNGSLDIQDSTTIIICIITSPDDVGF